MFFYSKPQSVAVFSEKITRILSVFLIVISSVSLAGWVTGNLAFAAWEKNYIPMATPTALLFLVFGILFLSASFFPQWKSLRFLTAVTVLTVIAVGGCVIISSDSGGSFWHLILARHAVEYSPALTGSMSPLTATCFIVAGLALLPRVVLPEEKRARFLPDVMAGIVFLLGGMSVIGYLYGTPLLYGGTITPIALPTAFLFLVLAVVLVIRDPEESILFDMLFGASMQSRLIRGFFPLIVLIMLVEGWVNIRFDVLILSVNPAVLELASTVISLVVSWFLIVALSRQTGRDIERAQGLLKISELQYRRLFEAAKDGILLVNAETGMIEDANPFLMELLGYTHREYLGKYLWDIGIFKDVQKCKEAFRELQVNSYIRYEDLPLCAVDGRDISVEFVSNVYNVGKKRIIQCNIRDITERKQAVEQFTRLFSEMVSGCSIQQIISDEQGKPVDYRTLSVNGAFEELFGVRREEVVGKLASAFLPPEELSRWVGIFGEVAGTGKPVSYEEFSPVNDKYFSGAAFRLKEDIVAVTFRDITEVKSAALILRKAKEDAEAASAAKSEFLTNVAHDLRTPMHAIQGFSSFLQSEKLTEKQKKFADVINDKAKSLMGLVEDILDVSRLEAGRLELRPVEFDLNEKVESVVELVKVELTGRDVAVSFLIQEGIPRLKGDVTRLNQVLVNLMSNAVKYTDKGEIIMRVERLWGAIPEDKCRIRVLVKDTGLGIPEDKLARIFDAFTRFHEFEGGKARQGEGLGLYITRKIVDLMKGGISVVSQVGVGTEFTVTLDFDIV